MPDNQDFPASRGPRGDQGHLAVAAAAGNARSATVERWADRQPAAVAVEDDRGQITYRTWVRLANHLADGLAELGVREGTRVAVRTRVRREWFVINRALAELGAEQVAVNWRLTPPEVRHIVTDSGAMMLLSDDPDPGRLRAALPGDVVIVTVGRASLDGFARYEDLLNTKNSRARNSRRGARAGEAPLIIYTSGTTGRPKGVRTRDRVHDDPGVYGEHVRSLMCGPPVDPGARTLLSLPLHHSAGPIAASLTHLAGGSLYATDRFDAEDVLRVIARHRISHWYAVPTMLAYLKALPAPVIARYDTSSLQSVVVGGAATPPALKDWFTATFGTDLLWETYGCTEAGMITRLSPEDQRRKRGSVGVPYAHVEVRVVDQQWSALAPGETGDIAVRSPSVIGRYLGQEPLGEHALSADGFFRTGDIGHLDADGYLFITDRATDVIIAGGVNIYPAEIEAVLVEHPDVLQAAVAGVPEDTFGEQPKAWIQLRHGSPVTAADIKDFCQGRLAPYKQPRQVEFVEDLPRNAMGKVTRSVLRDRAWQNKERKI